MSEPAPLQAVLPCSQCGRQFAHSDLVQIAGNWVCGECKPAFLSRVMASGAASPLGWQYGGFWIRFGARIIDGLVLGVPFIILFSSPDAKSVQGTKRSCQSESGGLCRSRS